MYTVEFDFDRTKIIIIDDTGSKEDLRVTLLEDDVNDTRTQLADITLESGYIFADTCPTNHTTLQQNLMTPAPPGSYTFAFIARQEPTVTEESAWTDVSI